MAQINVKLPLVHDDEAMDTTATAIATATVAPDRRQQNQTLLEIIQGQMVNHLKKYDRSEEPPGTVDEHVHAAVSSRLPVFDMSPIESATYPHYLLNVLRYCHHRNRVLAAWFANPFQRMDVAKMLENVAEEEHAMVRDIFTFLERYQLINMGYLPLPPQPAHSAESPHVLIVGAGPAGVAAARALVSAGVKVTIYEVRDRVGGRVNSRKINTSTGPIVLDMGASIITGFGGGNPMAIIAQQVKLKVHEMLPECPLFSTTGELLNPDLDRKVEELFTQLMDDAGQTRNDQPDNTSLEHRLLELKAKQPALTAEEELVFNWHMANLEFANSTCLDKVSLKHWDQDDGNEFTGPHCLIKDGYIQVIDRLAEGLDIRLNSHVTKVSYGAQPSITLKDGTEVFGSAVIVTVPLGVLQRGYIAFDPPLPKPKDEAIKRIGFGALDKVALLFERPPWKQGEEPPHLFGAISPSERGMFFLFINGTDMASGRPLILALTSGKAAIKMEAMPDHEVIGGAMAVLRRIFGADVPDPVGVAISRWGEDKYAHGAYSSIPPGCTGDDYDIYAESIGNKLHFAGEATNRYYPATVHGAMLSGYREAASILNVYKPMALSKPTSLSGNFTMPLTCAWDGCGAIIDPKQMLKDHMISAHLTPTEREHYYKNLSRSKRYFSRKIKVANPRYRLRSYVNVRKTEFIIEALPGADQLTANEKVLLQKLRLSPEFYNEATEKALELYKKYGPLTKTEMRKHFKIDVNKSSRLYDFWVTKGVIQPAANSYPTNMLSYS